MSYALTIISKLLFYLIYLKSPFLFIFFYIRETADRRNDSIMGKRVEKIGAPLKSREALRKRSHHFLQCPINLWQLIQVKHFLSFAFESFSPPTFRVTSACQIPWVGCYCLARQQLHDVNEKTEWLSKVALVAVRRQHLYLPDTLRTRPCSPYQMPVPFFSVLPFLFFINMRTVTTHPSRSS